MRQVETMISFIFLMGHVVQWQRKIARRRRRR
jgi:hypothetical protein